METILVTIGEKFSGEGKAILEELGTVTYANDLSEIINATVLVIGIGHTIDASVMNSAPNLKLIATATTGLDHIDTEHAASKDIEVISLKDETEFLNSITATAELALGLMIALSRNITGAALSVQDGKWDRGSFEGHSLKGKTLGVVGYGRLGKMMAGYGEALGMNVIFTDPDIEGGLEPEELLKTADVVSLHMHLTKETEGCICKEALSCMKPETILINTARGKIVDEAALIEALQAGKLAGYGTDVLADELSFGDKAQSPLIDYAKSHANVIITPHIGGMTHEAREATDTFIAKKVRVALQRV